jgi:hypothetical protein
MERYLLTTVWTKTVHFCPNISPRKEKYGSIAHLVLVVWHIEGPATPFSPVGQPPVGQHVAVIVLGQLAQLNM